MRSITKWLLTFTLLCMMGVVNAFAQDGTKTPILLVDKNGELATSDFDIVPIAPSTLDKTNLYSATFTPKADFKNAFQYLNMEVGDYDKIVIKFAEAVADGWNVNEYGGFKSLKGLTEYVVNLNGTPIEDFTIFNWEGCRAPITISECYFFKSADPLATQKSELSAAIARGKLYNSVAYTDATFATLTTKIADGETALAAEGATAESLTGATTGINDAIAALALKDGFTNLTADMYKHWNDNYNPTEGTAVNCAYELFKSVGQPYGDGSVQYLNFADISEYSKLIITVTEGTPRIMMNRLEVGNGGGDGNGGGYVQLTDAPVNGVVEVDLTQYDYAHLNAIKGANYGNVTVTGMFLYKAPAETPAEYTAIDWVAGDQGYENAQDLDGVAIDLDGEAKATMTCTKGTGNTTPKYYTTGSAIRTYGGNVITFKGEGITKIIITGVNGKTTDLTASTGELTKDGIITTWKGEADEIVLTNNTSNQQHIANLHVVYGGVEPDVEPVHIANTAETAYTVAKAIELIDAGEALDETVFVKGIVSKVDEYNETYKSITYWISTDGTEEGQQFQCYSGKGLEGAEFTSIDDIKVGATVIVKGKMKKHEDTYEFNYNNELVSYEAPVEDSELMKQANDLAADAEAVAVGKLLAAIEAAKESGDESNLQAAIDQFKADNADVEKDETKKVATNGWKKFTGNDAAGVCATQFAPAITTYDGREAQLAEVYETTTATTGQILYQKITGLTNGKYKVGFYGNAFYTSGRGFDSDMADGAEDVAYVFANDKKEFIVANIATETSENNFRQFDVDVTDGTITLGMGKEKPGTNWHTMQIYQLTWFTTAKAAYAASKEEMTTVVNAAKTLAADANKTNGKDAFDTAIADAEAALASNMLTIAEFDAELAKIKEAIETFKKANYYIDFAEGAYYVKDAVSGKMMAAGHDWGTRGIVNETGLDLTVAINTEKRMVTFDSQVKNSDVKHFLGGDLYMDALAADWALEALGSGFSITNGTQYINIDENDNLVMSDTPREWILISAEQRFEELTKATAENPVDATFLIQGANFSRNDQRNSAWNVSEDCTNKNLSGGNNINNCAESYHSTFTISQALKGAPIGIYKMTAQGFYRQDGETTETVPVFFIGEQTAEVPAKTGSEGSMSDASGSFTAGQYAIEPIEFTYLGDEDLVIGVKNETAVNQWIIFDNFKLTYYTSPLIAAKADLKAVINAAKALDTTNKEGVETLNNAIATAEGVLNAAEVETVNDAKTALEEAMVTFIKTTPILTLKAPADEDVTLTFGVWDTEDTFYVDFGNGELQAAKVGIDNKGPKREDGTTPTATKFSGKVAGDGTIKVYGNNDIWYYNTSGNVLPTTFDQPKLMNIVQMSITGADVESVTLPAYEKMTQFNFNNSSVKSVDVTKVTSLTSLTINSTTASKFEPQLESIDLSQNTELEYLSLQGNQNNHGKLTSLDLTNNTKLAGKGLYVQYNEISELKLGDNTLTLINVQDNKLSALDFAKLPNLKSLYAANNQLAGELDMTAYATLEDLQVNGNKLTEVKYTAITKTFYVDDNLFTLATIPAQPAGMNSKNKTKQFHYAPQAALEVAETVSELDLTSQLTVAKGELNPEAVGEAAAYSTWLENQTTTFSFVTENGIALVEGTDYEVTEPGKFKFLTAQTEKVHGVMLNAAFPKFTEAAPFTTTEFTVEVAAEEEELDPNLIEIAQDQGKTLDTFARTELVEGDDYNTYTCTEGIQVAFKMFDIDVKDCDYIIVKFAEPVAAGWELAFWGKNDNSTVAVPAGATEYKYVFAEDTKCAIVDNVLPQICMLHLWTGTTPLVAKVKGVYKHKASVPTGINSINTAIQNGNAYNMNGQKVNKAQKGLYIINGKKVFVK